MSNAKFIVRVGCGAITVALGIVLVPMVVASHQMYGVASHSLLFFGGMLLAAPLLIAENW